MSADDPPRRARLPRAARLSGDRFHQQVVQRGVRVACPLFALRATRASTPITRLGFRISRSFGGAVQRNRAKRIIREAFRLSRDRLPAGLLIVCLPRAGVRFKLIEVRAALEKLTTRAARLLSARPKTAPQPDSDA